MTLQELLEKTKGFIQQYNTPASYVVPKIQQSVSNYFKPVGNQLRTRDIIRELPSQFTPSQMGQNLMEAPKFNIGANSTNAFARTAGGFASGMLNPFISVKDYAKEASNQYYGVAPADTKKLVGIGLGASLDLGGLLGGGKLGQQLIKQGSKQIGMNTVPTLGRIMVQGAKSGIKMGGGFGAGYGLSESLTNGADIKETIKNILKQGSIGAMAGGFLGAGLPFASALGKGIIKDLANRRIPKETIPAKEVLIGVEDPGFEDDLVKRLKDKGIKPTVVYGGGKAKVYANLPEQSNRTHYTRDVFRQFREALPRPGMSIKETNPLYQEARKYKSAEEFVKAKSNAQHGTTANFSEFKKVNPSKGEAIYLSENGQTKARSMASVPNGKLMNVAVDESRVKTFDPRYTDNKEVNQIVQNAIDNVYGKGKYVYDPNAPIEKGNIINKVDDILQADVIKQGTKKGYNDFRFYEPSTHEYSRAITDNSLLQTKSQLTDIWNKANGGLQKSQPLQEGRKDLAMAKALGLKEVPKNNPIPERKLNIAKESVKSHIDETPQISNEDATSMIGNAVYKHQENPKTFEGIFKKWIGRREAAKTRGYLEGTKAPKGDGKLISSIESGSNEPEVAKFKQQTDRLYQEAKEAGVDMNHLDNYITHIWEQPQAEVEQIYKNARGKFGFAKERTVPTYEEGIKLGLTPKYTNPQQIISEYSRKLNESIANVEMINSLKKEGLIVPASVGSKQPGFSPITAPGIGHSISQISGDTKVIGNYYAPDEIAQKINRIFSPQDNGKLGTFFKGAAKVSSVVQDVTLSGGIPKTPINAFGLANMTKEFLSGRFIAPLKSMIRSTSGSFSKSFAEKNAPQIIKMQERGIPVNTELDTNILGENNIIQKIFTGGESGFWNKFKSTWSKSVNEPTFKRFMPQLQIHLFNDIETKALGAGKSAQEAADIAAEAVKNFYGITGLEKMATRNKLGQDITSTIFFAPRYRESMVNFWGKNIKSLIKNPLAGETTTNAKFMVGALAMYAGYDYLNYKLNGKHLWDNPTNKQDKLLIPTKGDKTMGVPFLSSIATMPRLALRTVSNVAKGDLKTAGTDVVQTLASSSIKPAIDLISNSDYFGNEIVKETDTAGEKFKKMGMYLVGSYNHPYIKAAMTSIGNDKPGYQIVSEAMELPIRFYKTSSIEKGYFWDKLSELEPVGTKFNELKKSDKEKAKEFYTKNEDKLLELAQLRNVANIYGKLKNEGDVEGANKLTQITGQKINAISLGESKSVFPTAQASTNSEKISKGELELAKLDFADSDKNFQIIGNKVLRRNDDGTITTQKKSIYDTQVINQRLERAKKNEDIKGWMTYAEQKYKKLEEQLKDPNTDDLEKETIQNDMADLNTLYAKYKEYGGFTKPKKGRKLKLKKISINFDMPEMPKTSQISSNLKITAPKVKSKKLKLSKVKKLRIKKTSAPSVSKRLV